eukprot:CAMPEP_0184404472 /NCGR_PEP_ID=MMETSP0007-20130409/85954_1 /TAXON_ID=97485 /ORGANISM="Prymnesium parvum, Strain Texoma1" /LENGTH=118 /DNA_ID=CAMNT_0026760621 /DNA_START=374 /DNA_END=727 /DNA_ORIENTATION=-
MHARYHTWHRIPGGRALTCCIDATIGSHRSGEIEAQMLRCATNACSDVAARRERQEAAACMQALDDVWQHRARFKLGRQFWRARRQGDRGLGRVDVDDHAACWVRWHDRIGCLRLALA